jgi:XTP/dITP diphosphohydrolase
MAAEPATLLLATRSADKLREIRQILSPVFRGRVISLDEAGVEPDPAEDDVEAFDTFLANAHAKAAYFHSLTGLPALADDSGISVHALDGAPGVRSKRFAGDGDGNAGPLSGADLDDANNRRLLRLLAGVPHPRRRAHYTCAAVLHLPDGRRCAALGTCAGFILEEPAGTGGFGYDPIFLDPVSGCSFGELAPELKNRRSHRARAFRGLAANLPPAR